MIQIKIKEHLPLFVNIPINFLFTNQKGRKYRAKNQSYEKDCSIDEEHPLSVPSSIIDNGRWVRAISTNQF